jgi:hypothetical protein
LTRDFKTAPLADTASAPPGRSGRLAATRERGSELNTSRRQAGRRISRKKVAAECGQPHRPATNYTARAVAGRAAATRPACIYNSRVRSVPFPITTMMHDCLDLHLLAWVMYYMSLRCASRFGARTTHARSGLKPPKACLVLWC